MSTTLSNRVGYLNPSWNEPNTPEAFNDGFSEAMMLVGSEFIGCVERIALSWWPARSIVQKAVDDRMNIHGNLPNKYQNIFLYFYIFYKLPVDYTII